MRAILALAILTAAAVTAGARAAATQTEPPVGTGPTATVPARPTKTEAPGAPKAAQSPGKASAAAKGKADKKPQYQGPNETDVRDAYTQRIARINAGSEKYLSGEAAAQVQIRLVKVELIECEALQERTDIYLCNVMVESALGSADPEIKRVEAVMAKEDALWAMR
jgi:hypothetical protein